VQFPIVIGLHRSRILDTMVLMAVLLAGAASLYFPCSMPIRGGVYLAILILAMLAWRALEPTITTVRLERSGDIFVARAGEHEFVQVLPEPGATVHPWLTVIRLSAEDGRSDILISAVDSQNWADFRRLRMFMRWQANFSELNDDA
jgi:toxin CptA